RVRLDETAIGDDALPHLATLPRVEYLNLFGTKVTDAGLTHLEKMAALRSVYLWRTDVTEEGVERLRAKRPELAVVLGGTLAPPPIDEEEDGEEGDETETVDAIAADLPGCCQAAKDAGGVCDHPCCVAAAERGEICPTCAK
ncbi:MAG: hypothetical protein HKO59_08660, partial [Phycisphaerales bacterium]|nr:hypothetical protein [Phycisphaerales bacterium]